jgi:hypothetical protein
VGTITKQKTVFGGFERVNEFMAHVHCCLINMAKSKQVVLLPLRLTDYAASMHI